MALVRSKDTKPELVVRRLTHRLGYRFRLHRRDLPGHPDLVFPSRRKVIFVHGCFWHRHPGCKATRVPKTRVEFWQRKFEDNVRRDAAAQEALAEAGWKVLVVWECEVRDVAELEDRLREFLGPSR
jgi:DNA mismatch endonuclease (patch repair protein)